MLIINYISAFIFLYFLNVIILNLIIGVLGYMGLKKNGMMYVLIYIANIILSIIIVALYYQPNIK